MKRILQIVFGSVGIVGLLALFVSACDHTDGINDVAVWQQRLQEAQDKGDQQGIEKAKLALKDLTSYWGKLVKDPGRREQSLTQLGFLKDSQTVPVLMQVWEEDQASRLKIAAILGDIGDDKAGEILVKNLKEATGSISAKNEINRLNFAILNALGKMKYKLAKDKFIEFLSSDKPNVATAACKGLGELGINDPKAVEGLKKILVKEGVDWMQAKKQALVSLGEMRAVDALPEIILNLWQDNGTYYPAASDALFRIGEPAIEPLTKTFKRQNQMVEDWLKQVRERAGKNADQLYPTGTIEAKVIEVLGDQENPKVAPVLYEYLETLTKRLDKEGQITMVEGQMCGLAAMAIGRSRDKSYAPKLAALLNSHSSQPAVIANFMLGLVILGDKSVVNEMMKIAAMELDFNSTDSRAKAFLAATRIGTPEQVTEQARAIMEKVAKQTMDQSPKTKDGKPRLTNKDEFKAFVDELKKIRNDYTKEKDEAKRAEMEKTFNEGSASFWLASFYLDMQKNMKRIELAKKCGDKVECYREALKSTVPEEKDRAAWELAHRNDGGSIDDLLAALNAAAKKREATVDPDAKYEIDSERQSYMWALRILAHNPAIAKDIEPKIKKQLDVEKLNKESIEQILVVIEHALGK